MTTHTPFPSTVQSPPAFEAGGLRLDLMVLWRGRWLIVLCILCTTLLAAAYAYRLATPIYRSHVTLMLEPQETQVIDVGVVLPGLGRDEQILNTQVEVLKSRSIVGTVVDQLNLTEDKEFNPLLRPEPRFQPRKMARAYLEARGLVSTRPEPSSHPDAVRDAVVSRLIRRLVISNHPDSLLFSVSIGTTDAQKTARIVNTLAETYIERQITMKSEATSLATGWLAGKVAELKQTLEQAEADARMARDQNPDITDARLAEDKRTLAALQTRIETGDPDGVLGLQSKLLTDRIEGMTAQMIAFQQLDRDAAATRLIYENFLGRLKETAAQAGTQLADARILSRAVVPSYPASPKTYLILVLGAILGAGAGALGVLARAHLRATFRSVEALEQATGLPVLAAVPELADRTREPLNVLTGKPNSPLSEAVRDMRSGLLLSNLDDPPRIVAVTSAVPDEGKTTHALLLAQNLANWGRKVLVIEADIRGRSFGRHFVVGNRRGIISVLAGLSTLRDTVFRPDGLDIDVLVGEKTPASASDVLSTARFRDFLARARETYDHVIIDTPPLLAVADARIIAGYSDATVMVVRWRRTRNAHLRRAISELRIKNVRLAGLVLTRINARKLKRYGKSGAYASPASLRTRL